MPSSYVKKFSGGEEKWKKAKKLAKSQGHGDDYAYITGIFKRMVGEAKLQVAARIANIYVRIKTLL